MSRALQHADALFDLGRYEQAAALAAQHLAADPDDATALVLLARCRHRLGDEQQALTTVEQALRVAPESVSAWLMHTHVLLALKEYEQAESSARRAVELAPQYWGSHYTLGIVLDRAVRGKRKRAAYESARTAAALAPEESDAHFLVGLTAHRTGNHRVAQQAYETALRLNPDSSEAHNNLSLLHLLALFTGCGSGSDLGESSRSVIPAFDCEGPMRPPRVLSVPPVPVHEPRSQREAAGAAVIDLDVPNVCGVELKVRSGASA
ncbi:tetratricopeptide repeat protein [Streptomyces sp. NPDC006430]|uniref:tetratricopeptide repeat protein n=1 Tax=Streptomyces sp. NPDC006430 TaxID=3154299 RepID=UPI0033A367CF